MNTKTLEFLFGISPFIIIFLFYLLIIHPQQISEYLKNFGKKMDFLDKEKERLKSL